MKIAKNFVRIIIFIGLFFYFYKKSRRFKQSSIGAFAATTIFFSALPKASATGQADAFTPSPPYYSRPNHRSGLKIFPNYPINEGKGRGYFDPKTELFVAIDADGVIRKTFVANEDLIKFLESSCQ